MAQAQPPSDLLGPSISSLQQAFPIQDDEIRIIDVLPGSSLDLIALECRVVSLHSDASFEALSYVWGDVHSKRTVDISGYSVEVTPILYTAFQHLRHPHKKRALWADQVCINQSDDVEKSHQVSLMRKIYKGCLQCVIWLGVIPSDKGFSTLDAGVALDFIHLLADERPFQSATADCEPPIFIVDSDPGQRARNAFRALIMGGNPWWSRVWTLQEASLPFAATLHWGPLTISLQTIETAALAMCSGRYFFGLLSKDKVGAEYNDLMNNFLYPVRGLSIARAGETPLNTLMRWRYRQATDPRDKVYGFVGLFRSNTLLRIPALRDVSYGLSPEVLLTNVGDRFRELLRHRYLRWNASKGVDVRIAASIDEWILHLCGVWIDDVEKTSEVYHLKVEDPVNDESLRSAILLSYHLVEEYQASRNSDLGADYVGGGTLKDAFWRTMLGNLIMEEMPKGVPKDHDMTDFEDLNVLQGTFLMFQNMYTSKLRNPSVNNQSSQFREPESN
ncbi:HET-domain-containing protein [Lentithecium fluviatile CBS 122367]|uniref:HET-domain-containing protein n=1 Tax=Lentithecium fluviatile CBS 122367 TaxID=1168545 RepID=A0A6G1J5J1_9PLEO|nr:HET-domain-containing protein [Lentithecium fluviatile CBS 122367]